MADLKDSGSRREFESGAVRDIQEGKGRCDLLPLDVIANLFVIENDTEKDTCYICSILQSINNFKRYGSLCTLYDALSIFSTMYYNDLLGEMILEVSKHFEDGCKKYGEDNWQKGIPVNCYIDSAIRHFMKFISGYEDEPHDRAFVWNILCCIWTCEHKPELNIYNKKKDISYNDAVNAIKKFGEAAASLY